MTQTDKEFCARLGLEVVESPDAFALVDDGTLLFGIHMELDVYNHALSTGLPAIYIGTGLQTWELVVDNGANSDGPLAPFSQMEATYDIHEFPDLDYMFACTVMYCRRGNTKAAPP